MAQKVNVLTVDDMDGTEGARRVTFALNDNSYEIDLASHNEKELRDALRPFIRNARKTGSKAKPSDIRQWAIENGYEVSSRGRLHRDVVKAYDEAHAV